MPEFNAYPALQIRSAFSPLAALGEVQDYQKQSSLQPLQIQEAQDEASIRHTQYGNSMLAQAADEALAADPDKAPAAWDARMNELANAGVPSARQYVGQYRKDLAERVKGSFGGTD